MAEDWSICQSWVVLFSWNSIGCFDGICLSHWWKGKERLKKFLLIFSSFNCFLVTSLFVKMSLNIGALAGNHLCTHCASVVTSYYNNTDQLGERGQILSLRFLFFMCIFSIYNLCSFWLG